MTMQELIDRLEKTIGPDLDLDHAIAAIIRPEDGHGVLLYTGDIEAALTTLPAGTRWLVGDGDPYPSAWANIRTKTGDAIHQHAATPALALCIAALKARMAVSTHENDGP